MSEGTRRPRHAKADELVFGKSPLGQLSASQLATAASPAPTLLLRPNYRLEKSGNYDRIIFYVRSRNMFAVFNERQGSRADDRADRELSNYGG